MEEGFHAAALAMQSLLGLICDPVAGLVEFPCIQRNVTASVMAAGCAIPHPSGRNHQGHAGRGTGSARLSALYL